jgi:nucleotide-binding universal stress UspA family protein
MSIVLAALDTTAAACPVLGTALGIGELTASSVEVVHVRSDPSESCETPKSLAGRYKVPFELMEGEVEPMLLAAIEAPKTIAAVIGARSTPGGQRPAGHTARYILEHTNKPIVVVPPDTTARHSLRRLLVPLEGTESSSRPVLERLWPLLVADVELVVLHAFTNRTLPAMLDRPEYDLEIWGREFLRRYFPRDVRIELRPGPVGAQIAEVSREYGADLIVLSWSQSNAADKARVIREVVGGSVLPVLLLPVVLDADGPAEVGTQRNKP